MKFYINRIRCLQNNNNGQDKGKHNSIIKGSNASYLHTPRYEFSSETILANYHTLCNLLPYAKIHYFLKANASPLVLGVLSKTECNFEISGRREYKRLRSLDVDNSRIICGLPIKPRELIHDLYQAGIRYFVFDHIFELKQLDKFAPTAKKILRIYIKDLINESIEYGVKFDDIKNNLEVIRKCDGLTFHISENWNIESIRLVLDRVESLMKMIKPRHNNFILNLGGGWRLGNEYESFYQYLKHRVELLRNDFSFQIYAEPGSAIVKTAGKVITKVICVRKNTTFVDVFIDAGSPIGVVRTPDYVENTRHEIISKGLYYRFIEITNMHRTLFIKKLSFTIKGEDILIFGGYGAYSIAYRSDFHLWDKPLELIVE